MAHSSPSHCWSSGRLLGFGELGPNHALKRKDRADKCGTRWHRGPWCIKMCLWNHPPRICLKHSVLSLTMDQGWLGCAVKNTRWLILCEHITFQQVGATTAVWQPLSEEAFLATTVKITLTPI